MVDAKQAIIFSTVFVVLVSIPAASEQVKIQENSKNGFEAVIDTKFSDKFSFEMRSGMEKMKLVNSGSEFRMKEKSSGRIKSIDTPKGSLKVIRSNNSVVKKTKTPYGTLKTGVRNGKRFSSFEGLNKSKVQNIKANLQSKLKLKLREAKAKKRAVMNRILPSAKLSIDEGGESEHVNITNTDNKTLNLDGWTMKNKEGDIYTFEASLSPGESLTLYSKDYSSSIENYVSETDVTLYSTGGEIEVRNTEGYLITAEDYN